MRLERKAATGFTLVEMAIVLVIIGIILAGVMKGRDIVRGAQVKQFSQQFAQKWATVAQTYYDKTGRFLNDGSNNGGDTNLSADGVMDGQAAEHAIAVVTACEAVGITPCTLVKSKIADEYGTTVQTVEADHCGTGGVNIFETLVEGEFSGNKRVLVDLSGLTITTGTQTFRRNCVVLYNVPTDVAIGLDTAIDGNEDGANGAFVNIEDVAVGSDPTDLANDHTTDNTAVVWGSATAGLTHTTAIMMDF